jgi:hypothetical protein
MIKIEFTQEEIKQLHYERFHHPHPRVQQRIETVYLKAPGYSHQEIGRVMRISQNSLRSYLEAYQAGGIEGLKQLNFYHPTSELNYHQETLEAEFKANPPKTIMDLAAELGIELLFLPSYSPNLNLIERLWKFVKKECLYSRYYETFELFKKAITGCLWA